MFKNLLLITTVLIILFLSFPANAQSDTSYYDLGRIRIKKDFVQSVTIKGEDLEKFPTTNLNDALTTWLSGVLTKTNGVVYVIDGDLINNVNAFSIFDIETVTLIENATTAINGINQTQNLVLIKTRVNTNGNSGINVAGQTNITGIDKRNNLSGQTTYYHQYYLSAYKNTDNTKMGISADYQHDALNRETITASTILFYRPIIDIFKFYGYLDRKFGEANSLNVSVNYVPETENANSVLNIYQSSPAVQNITEKTTPTLFNAKIALTSKLGTALNNKLNFNYGNSNTPDNQSAINTQTGNIYYQNTTSGGSQNNFLVRDNLQYQITKNDWNIEPSINLMFRYAKQNNTSAFISTGSVTSTAQYSSLNDYRVLLLTPSLSIDYKNIFNIQGGIIADLKPYADNKQISSFATVSVDALRLTTIADSYSWKFFGSFANYGNFYDSNTSLTNFNNYTVYTSPFYTTVNYLSPNKYHAFTNFQAGTTAGLFSNRLNFGYDFESREYLSLVSYYIPVASGFAVQPIYEFTTSKSHRFNITANILNGASVKWFITVNTTRLNYSYNNSFSNVVSNTFYTAAGWTGGWVNQVELGKLTIGAHMLYFINEFNGVNNINSFALQSAYVGYKIPSKKLNNLEVYANTRTPVQNGVSDITDNRTFYGLGFKAGF